MTTGWNAAKMFLLLLFGSLPVVSSSSTPSPPVGGATSQVAPTVFSTPQQTPVTGPANQGANSETSGPITRSKYLNPRMCGMFSVMREMLNRQAGGTDISQTTSCRRLCQGGIAPNACQCRYRANPCTVYRCPGGTGCTLEMCSDFLLPVCVAWDVLYRDLASDPTAVCNLPPDSGSCPGGLYTRYYYDQVSSSCKRFRYSGCGGNANSFTTLDSCRQLCGRSRPSPPNKVSVNRLPNGPSNILNTNANAVPSGNANANAITVAPGFSKMVKDNAATRLMPSASNDVSSMARLLSSFKSIAAARLSKARNANSNANSNQGLTPWQMLMRGQ